MEICLKARDLQSLDGLGLSKRLYSIVKDFSPEELIYIVRNHGKIKGIGEKRFEELEAALDLAGYIRHDFEPRSIGFDRLCECLDIYHSYDSHSRIAMRYGKFGSNEAYEEYRNITDQQAEETIALINDKLSPTEARAIKEYFSLEVKTRDPESHKQAHDALYYRSVRKAIRKLRFFANRNKLRDIACVPSEEECQNVLNSIMEEMAGLYDDPALKRERELRREISALSRRTSFTNAKRLKDFIDQYFFSPISHIGLDTHANFINLNHKGIHTAGDFVMYCYNHPKDWHIKGLHLENVQQVRSVINKVASLGCVLPLADTFNDDTFTTPLTMIGLKPQTLSELRRVCFARYHLVGDIVMLWQRSPKNWFCRDNIFSPEMSWYCYLDLVHKITALGYEVPFPASDETEVPKIGESGLPSFWDLRLKNGYSMTVRTMEELLACCAEHPDDWPKYAHCSTDDAIEIIVKMAALGYLEHLLPQSDNHLS